MILCTIDPSGQKKFLAGFYPDGSMAFTVVESNAMEKRHYGELKTIAVRLKLENYNIREVIPAKPLYAS